MKIIRISDEHIDNLTGNNKEPQWIPAVIESKYGLKQIAYNPFDDHVDNWWEYFYFEIVDNDKFLIFCLTYSDIIEK